MTPSMSFDALDYAISVSRLAYCNPFLPEKTVHEREAVGRVYVARYAAVVYRRPGTYEETARRLC